MKLNDLYNIADKEKIKIYDWYIENAYGCFINIDKINAIGLNYKNIDNLAKADLLDLVTVDEIGERIAQSVMDFFQNAENVAIINRLKQVGIQFELNEVSTSVSNILQGKIFVVSGVFEVYSRDDLKKTIEDNGGKVGSSISAKTSYVIAGENMGPAKLEKANQLNIKIINEHEFQQMING